MSSGVVIAIRIVPMMAGYSRHRTISATIARSGNLRNSQQQQAEQCVHVQHVAGPEHARVDDAEHEQPEQPPQVDLRRAVAARAPAGARAGS